MNIQELIKGISSIPMNGVPQPMPGAPAPVKAPVQKKLAMDANLSVEGQKVFQPGAEHKQGSPAPAPDAKGTAEKMEPKGWAGKSSG